MSDTTTDFFDNVGSGSGAPSALLKGLNDVVQGEIVEMFKKDFVPYGKTDAEADSNEPDGKRKQLVVILQTANRNWSNVAKVPKVDPSDNNSADKAPGEDDGKRAIYVPNRSNIQWAIGKAVQEAKAKFEVGGTLAVRVANLKDVGKGNPLKEHEARYTAKAASDGFFPPAEAPAAQAPAQAPAPTPAPAAAPAAPAPAAAPEQDPWATPGTTGTDEPPF